MSVWTEIELLTNPDGVALWSYFCLTWKSAPRSGRCRFSTSGVSEPLTGSGDRQTAKNGHDCVVELLLASDLSDNKLHALDFRRTPAAPAPLARRTPAEPESSGFPSTEGERVWFAMS